MTETVAALYDVHGNLPALEAVLAELDAEPVDRVVVGGDVYPGPLADECLHRLLELQTPVDFLFGNGETDLLALRRGDDVAVPEPHRGAMLWQAAALGADDATRLEGWPPIQRWSSGALGEVLFCHATPESDREIFTERTDVSKLRSRLDLDGVDLVVCGHTHMAFDRVVGSTRVVNAGSVGMPFGTPGAHWLRLGRQVDLRCTAYDLERAAERLRAAAYPLAADFAEQNVLACPPAEAMLEAFSRAEID